ncbi:MAG TPA: DUF4215 domain-containing protein, partial [Vulgatibacter sp.]
MARSFLIAASICFLVLSACGGDPEDTGPGATGGTGGIAGSGGSGGSGGSSGDGGSGGEGATGGVGGHAGEGGSGGVAGAGGSGGEGGEGGAGGEGGTGGSGGEPNLCGNDVVDDGESCDDGNTDPGDGCSTDCQIEPGWDCTAGGCVPVCGDGALVGSEECDGGELGGLTCADFGGNVGTLSCTEGCTIDSSACTLVELCEGGEDDDGNGLVDCEDPACAGTPSCLFCGNDSREGDEACDGLDLAGASCESLGFLGGQLLCD